MSGKSGRERNLAPSADVLALLERLNPPILRGLTPDDLAEILAQARLRKVEKHTILIHEGHSATRMYLLLEGMARFFATPPTGEKYLVKTMIPGDVIGGMALLGPEAAYLCNCITLEGCSLLAWKDGVIEGLAKRHPVLTRNMVSISANYLTYSIEREMSALRGASSKVLWLLRRAVVVLGVPMEGGVWCEISNDDIAAATGVTKRTVSRLLNEWTRDGYLTRRRGGIVIHSIEKLKHHVEEQLSDPT